MELVFWERDRLVLAVLAQILMLVLRPRMVVLVAALALLEATAQETLALRSPTGRGVITAVVLERQMAPSEQ